MLNGFDILWLILAVSSGWGLLSKAKYGVPILRRAGER